MTAIEHDKLLTDAEASILLGTSVPTFWRWRREGRVPNPVKLGRLSRWPQSEIVAILEKAKAARKVAA